MANYSLKLTTLSIMAALTAFSTASADVWRLGQDQDWQTISPQDKFLVAVADAKKLVNTGQRELARQAYDKLKKDYPSLAGEDFDALIEAEMLFCEGSFTKAYRAYEKILVDYPNTTLELVLLDRQFAIGTAYLGGEQKTVLKIIKLKGDAEGIRIMEKITDRAGIGSPLGLRASVSIVENYLRRELFNEAYLKWWEVSIQYKTGPVAKEALLGMAQAKHAVYNRPDEEKRAFFDAATLSSARTYYQNFNSLYPEDAKRLAIEDTIKQIDEQLADKQLTVARYYHRTGRFQSANLYYDLVSADYPQTEAAELARKLRAGTIDPDEIDK